jgi:polar amino acid transport system substrate-binding protein
VIARSASWDNVELSGTAKNVLGFSEDLLTQIAEVEHFQYSIYTASEEKSLLDLLDEKGIDAVFTAAEPTQMNESKYLFSDPFFTIGPVLLVRQDSSFMTTHDLQDADIAFERNGPWGVVGANLMQAHFQPYDQLGKALNNVDEGSIDAVIIDAIAAHHLVQGLYKGSLRIIGPPLTPISLRVAVKRGKHEEFIKLFNEGLKTVQKSGLYSKILNYWDLYNATDAT